MASSQMSWESQRNTNLLLILLFRKVEEAAPCIALTRLVGEEFDVEIPCMDSKESSGQDTVPDRGSSGWAHFGSPHSLPVVVSLDPKDGDGAFLTSISCFYSLPYYGADILGWTLFKKILLITCAKNTKEDFCRGSGQ